MDENTVASGRSYGDGISWKVDNPFSFRVFQIFTGVGVGCGVGIGVGKPIYMGSIPAFQQVMSATQGAMDVFSKVGRHANINLRRLGVKNVEAGIGCGVGIGHGFGVGIALKPGAAHKLQTFIGSLIGKITERIGALPGPPTLQEPIKGPNSLPPRTSKSEPVKFPISSSSKDEIAPVSSSEASVGSRTEKVIKSFLESPIFEKEEQPDVDELVKKLKSENNILQLLINHQRIIDGLIEENERLHRILVEDLKVSPSKLGRSHENYSERIDRLRGRKR